MPRTRLDIVKEKDTRKTFKDLGHKFSIGKDEFECRFSATEEEDLLAADGGGFLESYAMTATVIKTDFPDGLPAKGKTVEADGQTYQVAKVSVTPFSVIAKIHFENLDA